MTTIEELREKEIVWKQQMLFWRNKYESLEEKVEKIAKDCPTDTTSNTTNSQSNDTSSEKVVHQQLVTIIADLSATREEIASTERKVIDWFHVIQEKIEDDDQYSRKNNALIHGFKKLPNIRGRAFIEWIANELNYIFPSLNGTILPCHIDDAHPLTTRKNGSTKVVIIKFVNRWIKDDILKCKQDAYNVGLSVTEHLTKKSLNLLSLSQSLVGEDAAWVYKCGVFARYNGKKYSIKKQADIDNLRNFISENPPLPQADEVPNDNIPSADNFTSNYRNQTMPTGTNYNYDVSYSNRGRPQGRPSFNGRGRYVNRSYHHNR